MINHDKKEYEKEYICITESPCCITEIKYNIVDQLYSNKKKKKTEVMMGCLPCHCYYESHVGLAHDSAWVPCRLAGWSVPTPSTCFFWAGGQAAIPTITASLKVRGGKDSVFQSHILICESSFVVRQPRTLMLRVRKVFRKLFVLFPSQPCTYNSVSCH